jgi:hypothetical protein
VRTQSPPAPAAEGETASGPSWWSAWKALVYVSIASGHSPADAQGSDCAAGGACVRVTDAFGRVLEDHQSAAVIVAKGCPGDDTCATQDCTTLVQGADRRQLHALATLP